MSTTREDARLRHEQIAPPSRIKTTQRIDFRPGYFESVLEQHGRPTWWEKAAACACRNNATTSQPNAMCPVCAGIGVEYYDGQVIPTLYENLESNQDTLNAFGTWTFGSARLTMRSEYRPNSRDRYTFLQSVLPFSERRLRGPGSRDRLRYPIATLKQDLMVRRPDGELVRRSGHQRGVLRLRRMDATTLLPAQVLIEGDDFEIVNDQQAFDVNGEPVELGGVIDWTKGDLLATSPPAGALYAVTYLFHPRYEVVTFNSAIRDDNSRQKVPGPPGIRVEHMPLEVLVKLDWDTTQPGAGFGG